MHLLEKVQLGNLELQNAMAMAPINWSRANQAGEVSDLTRLYYEQRSSAGLLITEGINISDDAIGSPFTPGIYTDTQIAAWQKVTQAVHEKAVKYSPNFGTQVGLDTRLTKTADYPLLRRLLASRDNSILPHKAQNLTKPHKP